MLIDSVFVKYAHCNIRRTIFIELNFPDLFLEIPEDLHPTSDIEAPHHVSEDHPDHHQECEDLHHLG